MKQIRPIAVYLPQFHPIPENDSWWGKGFTEWTNVVRAKSLFKGHYQPNFSTDLGYYDLRLPEVREAQAILAQENGIYGFCYYHYWFNGRRILERPFREVFESGKPDFPFLLCWANENWTRRWDGEEQDVLLKQSYSEYDDKKHILELIKYFKDERYIKVNGKPVFLVYKTDLLPDAKRTSDIWRETARKNGIDEIYLIRVEATDWHTRPEEIGFDASMQFHPDWRKIDNCRITSDLNLKVFSLISKIHLAGKIYKKLFNPNLALINNMVINYEEYIKEFESPEAINYKRFPCVMPSWDNSPRRQNGNSIIFLNSCPGLYGKWLKNATEKFLPYSPDENFIFINAWNEWAEGNFLEPSQQYGHEYLMATKEALSFEG